MTDPINLIRRRRKITGMSAILLPFSDDGAVDWDGFCAHVARTADAGLTPAVNMDIRYVNLLDDFYKHGEEADQLAEAKQCQKEAMSS